MNDLEALQFVKRVVPELSDAETQFVTVVGRFETNYGAGWVHLAEKLGAPDPQSYANVHNWGAITAPLPGPKQGPAFFMRDRWWRLYDTLEDGVKDAARIILKPNVKAALGRGDGSAAVQAMGDNGYFIEPKKPKAEQIAAYRSNVQRNYDDMIRLSGAPGLLHFTGAGTTSRIGDFLIAGAFVGGILGAILLLGGGGGGEAGGPE